MTCRRVCWEMPGAAATEASASAGLPCGLRGRTAISASILIRTPNSMPALGGGCRSCRAGRAVQAGTILEVLTGVVRAVRGSVAGRADFRPGTGPDRRDLDDADAAWPVSCSLAKMFQQRDRARQLVAPCPQQPLAADGVDRDGRQQVAQAAGALASNGRNAAAGPPREVPDSSASRRKAGSTVSCSTISLVPVSAH